MFEKNNSLKVLMLSNGIFVFAGNLLGPLYAIFVEKFEVEIFSISLSWAVFMISAMIITFVVARFGDGLKEKEYMLITGFLIRSVCWLLYIIVPNFRSFLAVQALLGIGEGIGSPAFEALFAEHIDKKESIREYSVWKIISYSTLAVATILGGTIVTFFGFAPLFIIMAFLSLLAAFIVIITPRKLL